MSQHEDREETDDGVPAADQERDAEDSSRQADEAGADQSDNPDGDALARAEAEVTRLSEALARNQAERVNHEKRMEREMDKARKFALERLMGDFVQVLDSLDQALAAKPSQASDDAAGELEGLALTRRLALKVLESHGLETLDPKGQPFDANWHEAMTAAPTDEAEPDTVLEVLQTGYALNGRLLRPARVVVARAP